MKKTAKRLLSAVLMVALALTITPAFMLRVDAALTISGGSTNSATWIFDPGHGGSDPGASGCGRIEANDVLDMAKRVGQIMIDSGESVAFTRISDSTVSLSQRSSMENSGNFTYFVSFHRNAYDGSAHGVETFYYSGLSASSSSANLATLVQNELVNLNIWYNRGVKSENFHVLRETSCDAILMELGFVDNDQDSPKFATHFEQIAQAIARGLLKKVGKTPGKSDTEKPKITDAKVINVTSKGYDVTCKATDNEGVVRVQFPTWTVYKDQDDIVPDWTTSSKSSGTKNGDTYTYHVNISDHNNETGTYVTHIYAFDKAGNATSAGVQVTIQDDAKNLIPKANTTYKVNQQVVSGVAIKTTPTVLLSGFSGTSVKKVFNKSGAELSDGNVGTGCTIKLYVDNAVVNTYTICIKGDIDGDGNTTVNDYANLKISFKSNKVLAGIDKTAADVTGDGKITTSDYLLLKLASAGKSTIKQ